MLFDTQCKKTFIATIIIIFSTQAAIKATIIKLFEQKQNKTSITKSNFPIYTVKGPNL